MFPLLQSTDAFWGFHSKDMLSNSKSYSSASLYPYGCSQDACKQPHKGTAVLGWLAPKCPYQRISHLGQVHSPWQHSVSKWTQKRVPQYRSKPHNSPASKLKQIYFSTYSIMVWYKRTHCSLIGWSGCDEGHWQYTRRATEEIILFFSDNVFPCWTKADACNADPNIFTENFCKAVFNVHSRAGRQQGPWMASKGEYTQAVVRQYRWFKTEPKPRNLALLDQNLMPFDCCFLFSQQAIVDDKDFKLTSSSLLHQLTMK